MTLIDLQMPVVDGLKAITAIRSEFPDATIIVLTTFPGDARVVRAFTLGATSYLLKTARREEVIKAIRGALTGRHIVAPEVAQEIASHAGREGLTDREIVVLSLVAQGRSNRHIAIGVEHHGRYGQGAHEEHHGQSWALKTAHTP